MNGPKHRPIAEVPNRCAKKIRAIITSVRGMTGGSAITEESPSMEVVTVMAGVMTPSAISVAAPRAATR